MLYRTTTRMNELSYHNITRLKNISNYILGKAYLDIEEREFILHFPNRLRSNILDTGIDELIILYQRATAQAPRYLTHLVRPIDNELIEENARENFRFGRLVEVVSFPKQFNIPFSSSPLSKIDLRNRGWGDAELLSNLIQHKELNNVKEQLWRLFQPFMLNSLRSSSKHDHTFLNDELNNDFETEEGKELYRKHRVRERDSSLSLEKKNQAIRNGNLKCEVCDFSFRKTYNQEYIECHHIIPIHLGERITRLEDLALVCSNCHRMLHRRINDKYITIIELKQRIKES